MLAGMSRVSVLRIAFALSALSSSLVGCPTPVDPVVPDAPFVIPDVPPDAGPEPIWTESDPFPVPIAYATATILTSGGLRWIFVIGGADADRDSLGTLYSSVYRAQLLPSGSLGPWENAGSIAVGTGSGTLMLQLAQHGAIAINGEDGRQGVAIAGGMSSAGPLPLVLATYVSGDGSIDTFGRFDAMLAAGEGHALGTFDRFGAHELALVGGFGGDGATGLGPPTDRVDIALIEVEHMAPMFAPGPPLPSPRVAHRSVAVGTTVYVVGGESDVAPQLDVLRTVRVSGGAVTGWETVGTLSNAPSDHAAFVVDDQLWVVGGIEGGRTDGAATTRARHATIAVDGTVGAFTDSSEHELPTPLADSALVTDDVFVYLIGGRSVGGLQASTTVLIGRF
jgi:hypothetical protein